MNLPTHRSFANVGRSLGAAIATLLLTSSAVLAQTAVDLNAWTAESYPAVAGFGAGVWTVAPGGASVVQSVNGQPTLFYSDFSVFNNEVQGQITASSGDDDYIGFVLGFGPGDTTNPGADYLLVDWKRVTQAHTFGAPSCTPGTTAPAGLAVSRVTGIPTADEFWGHTDFDATCSPLGHGLQELARATNLGATGWAPGTTYTFRFDFDATSLKVYVDDVLELDIAGTFANGRMGFYNFSQAGVTYNAFTLQCNAAWQNYGTGWAGASGVPSLTLDSNPVLGSSIRIMLGNASGTTTAAGFLLGDSQASLLTPFGGTLLVTPMVIVPVPTLPPAGHTVTYAIPNDIALCGLAVYSQLVHADAAASAGVAFSQGLSIVFGF